MPSPSRWGPAAGYVNISAPRWVFDAVDALRQEKDWKTMGNAGLELIVEALHARGIRRPDLPAEESASLPLEAPPPRKRGRTGA